MVAAMNQNFTSIDEIIHRFEAVQIDRDASIMHYHQFKNRNNGNKYKKQNQNKNWNKNNYMNNSKKNYYYSKKNNSKNNTEVRKIDTEAQENSEAPHQQRMGERYSK